MRPALAHALLVVALLAGCAAPPPAPAEVAEAVADTRPMDWSPGNWWSYHATIGNETFDVALIVHERTADGFRLGTNLSVGFFGLPFHGNVSDELNPRIGGEVWPLFHFPLDDGKSWAYTLFGYDARTVASAALVEVPGLEGAPGFLLESTSFGQTFARYSYAPEVGWFTRLELIEPTNGTTVLLAELSAYGHDWDAAYYVEETLREIRLRYPALPGREEIRVPAGYLQARVSLLAQSASGVLMGRLLDEDGRPLARVDVLVAGADTDRASAKGDGATTWTLDHKGAGTGTIYLEVTGVSATGPLAAPRATSLNMDLAALLQSTRPAFPQDGQTISTALPVGV